VASSGTTVYLRGGTYNGFSFAGADANYNFVYDIKKSGITCEWYPGETPILDFTGTQKQSEFFRIEGNATFDSGMWHDNAANGFYFTTN
jgi:hypothetical protein